MIKGYHRFWAAVSFYTRLPLPKHVNFEFSNNGEASKYMPLVGIIIGALQAGVFYSSDLFFPKSISIVFVFIAGAFLTGFMHEDGFSDFLDGFGGGWNKEKILAIMKDSSSGVFGVCGLILIFLLKFAVLYETPESIIPAVIILAGVLSRCNAISFMYDMSYARIENSKAGGMVKPFSISELFFAIVVSIAVTFCVGNYWYFLAFPVLFIFRQWVKSFMNKWIEGYTGDCLGFVQQISEILVFLVVFIIVTAIH